MKKTLTAILAALLLISVCLSFTACSKEKTSNPIKFEEKYVNAAETTSYIFYADGTGEYEIHKDWGEGDVSSGTIEFVWREASDGAVYLFETDRSYNDDHTDGKNLDFDWYKLYFGEDFFIKHEGALYIIEDSDLYEDYID